jgi:excisionase family DNA binding protein
MGGVAATSSEVASAGPAAEDRPQLISVSEAARRLSIPERTVRWRLAKGTLPGHKLGDRWVVEWRLDG